MHTNTHSASAGAARGAISFVTVLTAVTSLFVASLAAPSAHAQGDDAPAAVDPSERWLEGYLSEDAFQMQYGWRMNVDRIGALQARVGMFYNEARDLIAIGDLLTPIGDRVDVRRLQVRVGTRAYAAFLSQEDQDIFGLGVGGEAEYFLGRDSRTSVKLSLYYAPDIITFGFADNIYDVSMRLQTRIRGGTDLFVGYRLLEIDTQLDDRKVDDNIHLGFRHRF